MRRKGIFVCFVCGLLGILGCATKRMPEGELISVKYLIWGSVDGYEYEGVVRQDSTGVFVLKAMKESLGPLFEKRLDAKDMARFRQIIEEEKMYQYKEEYTPLMKVYDGTQWSFEAAFTDGTVICSQGTNASPHGEGLSMIRSYMEVLIQDSE